MLHKTAYQYWVDCTWAPVGSNETAPIADGMAGELSVHHDEARGLWRMTYLDPLRGDIVLRESNSPQGQWTAPTTLIDTAEYPKTSGGCIHPWSTSNELYSTVSEWDSYNVYLVKAELRSP